MAPYSVAVGDLSYLTVGDGVAFQRTQNKEPVKHALRISNRYRGLRQRRKREQQGRRQ